MYSLFETVKQIASPDNDAIKQAWIKLNGLSKPVGSLGKLEEIAAKMAGITGRLDNKINKKTIIIMCADNGVCDEGISSCPQDVTATVTRNFLKGITGVCVLARTAKADITVVDIGVKENFTEKEIINRKLMYGTNNIRFGQAMPRETAIKAIETGIEMVDDLVSKGYNLFGTGEMGIGNTTTAAAVLCVLSGMDPEIVVGKGAGLTDDQLQNKKRVVADALKVNSPFDGDTIDILAKVGGLDIAGMCGSFIGAAKNRVPIVIDGFISSVAALCAIKLNPEIKGFIFPSHLSAEHGAKYVMEKLQLEPMLNMDMRLGEGTGCALEFMIIEAALNIINEMPTFEEAEIEKGDYLNVWDATN
jgi:nicotinate-nucleotide--dimethylbenzimidazole phosphoribosyltransferase